MKVKLIILSVLTLGLFLVLPTTATANTSTKLFAAIVPMCQQDNPADTTIFKTRIENKEYQVWFEIDFYKQNILVPNQKVVWRSARLSWCCTRFTKVDYF